jgi:hypothetical protein
MRLRHSFPLILICLLAEAPFMQRLSERTLYLRIPSFRFEQKPAIDSVLAANDGLIRSMENLVIDIRNGTGGSDVSYRNLIPYLYTGPMRSMGVKLWYTMSMSHRLPHMPVDVMGIQPDHYMDEGIPLSNWITHVQRVLEGR